MRFPKLNRKQKIARNFLLIALALLLFEPMRKLLQKLYQRE